MISSTYCKYQDLIFLQHYNYRPEAVSELVAAHYPRANNRFWPARVLDEVPQSFLRTNHYGHAFSSRNPLDPTDVLVEDASILWAEEPIANEMMNKLEVLESPLGTHSGEL